MVITAVPQEKNAISTVNFTHSAVSNHSLVTSNIEDSPDLLILSAWIIQLSKYWGVESLEVGIKSLESSSKNNFCAINLGDQLKSIEMIGILEELTSGRQAPTQEWISLTDIQHYCIIAPQEAGIFDDNAFRVWQHPECKFQLLLCGDTQLFPHIDERRVYSHFERVLQQLTQSPHANVISIDCLPEQEYNQLIKHWNDTDRNFPITQCIDELFRTQAARTPNQVAIRFKGQSLSYQQLFTNVSQFSQFLIDQEVAPGDVVGLCLMRTPLWPIGMLAIWSVGAVFLPLEAELPDERLSYILEDSQCKLVITEPLLKERFSGQNQQVSEIKLEQLELFEQWKEPVIKPANTLAYIIYTSGTTGLPKGVKVNHKGLSNLAYCQYERMNFEPNQRVLQAVSFNFDASLHDVTFALLSGSALCIADENERLPGLAMVDFLRNEKINFITLPPSALETLPFEELPNLHTILAVGEVCGSGLVNRWAGVKKFFNGYGPTETTVGALIGECFSNEHKPTIGTALANVKIYILDSRKKPVPIGVVGEIYVGGVGVARGYVNQPDKTANTFIVNPFVDDESATLYKTGDKARFLDDGRVDFIGRIDDQVKIAGRRIEIEEIEARCKAFEDVVNAAVIVHSDEAGNKLLRAFVILRKAKSAHADINNLKSYLSKYLPSYMLPIQYFLLKEFPSSINGKLDRKKLERIEHNYDTPLKEIKNSLNLQNIIIALKNIGNNIYLPICYFASKQNQVDSDEILGLLEQIVEPYQQPFTLFSLGFLPTLDTPKALVQLPIPTEYEMQWLNLRARPASKSQKILEKIWLRELNSNEVFLEDNFVECGGDSIKAVRIILELKNKTGVELTGADIFGSNFGYCAARLESEISGNPLVLSTPGKVDPPPPVSAFFFKNNSYDLYGVYHPPLEASIQQTAFLLCPAITNDYQRSRPLLQNLATKLCSAGFPSMRFDYFGCGDSEGESEEISIDECRSSILAAINQLKRQSGCNKIILFGLRFGATLVSELADSNHADFHGIVDRIVLFDPIRNGKEFLADQRSLHSSLLNDPNYFQWRKQVREFDDYEEILGQAFSHQFIDQLSELSCSINQQSDMNIAKNESLTKYRIDVIYSKNVEPFTLKSNDVKEQMYINHFQIEDECGWKAQDKIDSTIITNNLAQQVINCVQRKST